MARKRVFTIYDKMEDDGYFEANAANVGSRDAQGRRLYKGPVEYPRMVYHPEGLHKITTAGRPEATPFGPIMVGEQREVVNMLVDDEPSYKMAKDEGWFDTPAESIAKNPKRLTAGELSLANVPLASAPTSVETELAAAQRKIADLEAKLADADV
jgi:hypothetical protein